MVPQVKTFVREHYTLIVDTTAGRRVVRRIPHASTKVVELENAEGKLTAVEVTEPAQSQQRVSLARKAANAAKAAAIHAKAGFPRSSTEDIAKRYAICQACEHLIPSEGDGFECAQCGCGIRGVDDSGKRFNKLAWAEQKCPIDRWLPVEPVAAAE